MVTTKKSLTESLKALREEEALPLEAPARVYFEKPVDWNKTTLTDEQVEHLLSALKAQCDGAKKVEDWRCLLVVECPSEKTARFTFDTEVKEEGPFIHAHGLVKDGDVWACKVDMSEKLDGLDLIDFATRLYNEAFAGTDPNND